MTLMAFFFMTKRGCKADLFENSWRARSFKVAEHSFRACFCWCNTDLARAQGFQRTNMPSVERSFYLLGTRFICVIFFYNWMQCIELQRYVRKGNDAKKEPSNFQLLFVTERTQLYETHAQLLKKLRSITLAETRWFLTIHSLEFQEIWQKHRSETTWMIYRKKSEFWHREILITQKMINDQLRKSPMSKFD